MTISGDAILFNPFDPAFRADPYPFYDRLRSAEPVHVTPFGFTVLTRYEDVARTLRGSEFSRDIEANSPEPTDPIRRERRERFRKRLEEGRAAKTILNLDPPDHTRLRRLVTLAFTPSAPSSGCARGSSSWSTTCSTSPPTRGSMELVDELAFPVPFQVISDLLRSADRALRRDARMVAGADGIARADGRRGHAGSCRAGRSR